MSMNTENMGVRDKIGKIFVNLTQRIYGGEINNNGNSQETKNIDIIGWEKNQAYESKASITSDHHKIQAHKIREYQELKDQQFPLDNPEIYFMFWQYRGRGISKVDDDNLERKVISNTKKLLVVSFDIIEKGIEFWHLTGKNSWGATYQLKCSERKRLMEDTNNELRKMELDPRNYTITKGVIPKGTYRYHPKLTESYGWTPLPEIEITSIINSEWNGLELVTSKNGRSLSL